MANLGSSLLTPSFMSDGAGSSKLTDGVDANAGDQQDDDDASTARPIFKVSAGTRIGHACHSASANMAFA
jgi:hypothetical protein